VPPRKKTTYKKRRRKVQKKKAPAPAYPLYTGLSLVLLALLTVLLWPSEPEYVADTPIYEDVQSVPAQVEAVQVSAQVVAPKTVLQPPKKVQVPAIKVVSQPKQKLAPPRVSKVTQYALVKHQGVALVLDDVGYDLHALKRILALPIPVAISVIPDAPYAAEAAEMAHAAGHVVMLHMPMEPSNPHYRNKMDHSFLRIDMDKATVRSMLLQGLSKVPYVQGINNHMGSLFTSLPEPMAWVTEVCKEKGLFFIDSKTSSKSVAAHVAAQYGLVWGSRRVFLDHSVAAVDMQKAWLSALHCGRQKGGCIVIGHPHAETVAFLEKHVPLLQENSMVGVLDLLHHPQ